jgi:hypothetical protein
MGNRLGHDDVERGEAVAGHHQQSIVTDGVDVPDLPGVDVGEAEIGHGITPWG